MKHPNMQKLLRGVLNKEWRKYTILSVATGIHAIINFLSAIRICRRRWEYPLGADRTVNRRWRGEVGIQGPVPDRGSMGRPRFHEPEGRPSVVNLSHRQDPLPRSKIPVQDDAFREPPIDYPKSPVRFLCADQTARPRCLGVDVYSNCYSVPVAWRHAIRQRVLGLWEFPGYGKIRESWGQLSTRMARASTLRAKSPDVGVSRGRDIFNSKYDRRFACGGFLNYS